MLSEAIITTIFRGIPEASIYVYSMYAFSDKKIDKRKFILSMALLAMIMMLIRALPISYGIHTMIIMMAIIAIAVLVNNFDIVHAITVVIVSLIIQFIAEAINIVLIDKIFKMDVQQAMATTTSKMIYGIPSLIIAVGMVFIICRLWKKQRGKSV